MGIRPNGTIPFRGERPSSDSTRPSRSPPGVFIMRKAVAAIRWCNTLSAVLLAIQKPAGQANSPTYRRLSCFFVLTKGMTLIGPRPERPAFCEEFEKRIHGWHYCTMVTPGLSGLAQVTGGYDLLPKEKVVLDLWKCVCSWSLDHGEDFYLLIYIDTDHNVLGDYEVRIVFNDCLGYRYMETFSLVVERDASGRANASIDYVARKTMID